jgi:hypothetical protein
VVPKFWLGIGLDRPFTSPVTETETDSVNCSGHDILFNFNSPDREVAVCSVIISIGDRALRESHPAQRKTQRDG